MLVERYKIIEEKRIKELLNIYFEKYDKNRSYEQSVRNVFSKIKNEALYKEEAKKWEISISRFADAHFRRVFPQKFDGHSRNSIPLPRLRRYGHAKVVPSG